MRARLASPALALLLLAGCGESEPAANPAAPAAPGAPATGAHSSAPTDPAKLALLAALPAPYDQGDLENGRRVFARCRACHTITEGGRDMTGPNLWGLFGREAGARPEFNYSEAVREADFVWDAERLDHWLENPREFLPGNRMAFAGVRDEADRRDLIAFLKVETGYQPG